VALPGQYACSLKYKRGNVPGGRVPQWSKPGSTEAHMWHDASTLVRDPFSPFGHCTL